MVYGAIVEVSLEERVDRGVAGLAGSHGQCWKCGSDWGEWEGGKSGDHHFVPVLSQPITAQHRLCSTIVTEIFQLTLTILN